MFKREEKEEKGKMGTKCCELEAGKFFERRGNLSFKASKKEA